MLHPFVDINGLLRSARRCHPLVLQLHAALLKSGDLARTSFLSSLLDAYAKSGHPDDAHRLFDETPRRDVVIYTPILSALSRTGSSLATFALFWHMVVVDAIPPDAFVLATLVNACAGLGALRLGRQVHSYFLLSPFSDDDVVKSSLIDMYAKCGAIDDARKVFDRMSEKNHVCWTAMVYGYACSGRKLESLELFHQIQKRDLFAWTALISGFLRSGHSFDSVNLFAKMRREGVAIEDAFVLSAVIGAASEMAAHELGRQLHVLVVTLGYESNMILGNALVDMYAKCSDIHSARVVFDTIPMRDIISWTTMVVGEAQHGRAEEALALYEKMVLAGVEPNEVTFVGLIYACSHAGLVQKGRNLFDLMVNVYGITPSLQHYTCLLDLLSRSGKLVEAENIMKTMPYEPDEAMWAALLSACLKHKGTATSVRVADHLLGLKPQEPSTYILLSNTYATAGKWESVANVRKLMVGMEIRKDPGYSWIELGKKSYLFCAGEVPHKLKDEILQLLGELLVEMKKRGYVRETSSIMHDLDEDEKEQHLLLHSERLAVAFALLNSIPGSTIRVIKNLRVCVDCHNFLKLITDITGREIIIRDASRFHHFECNSCSCGDFW